ncbi:MAG: hypothetical protein RJB26_1509 [Pseudomonadota bacterium]
MNTVDRRQVLGALSAAAVFATGAGRAVARSATRRPDVIFIMADDMGYADLSCTGSRHIRTPNIDRLGTEGVHLTQGYSSTPICSPTRTALLTGCYAQRFEVGIEEPLANNAPPGIGVPFERPTLASVFRDMGYRTQLVGKWHLGDPPKHGPRQHGYDEFFGIVEGAADYFGHRMVVEGRQVGVGLAAGDAGTTREGYLTDLFGDEAVRAIEGAGDLPLFLSLHFTAPHWPWEGREDAEVAKRLGNSRHNDGGNLAKYRELVEAMDQNVAKVMAALAKSGRADNAIVVFTSDNGGERFSDTWPFIGQKGELLEGGIRVPILVRAPGRIPSGTRSDQVMASMDFLPTLLAMAGGDVAKAGTFDGVDLSSVLSGKTPALARRLCWRFKAAQQAAIRDGDWKYLKLGGKEHLFDLAEDVRERADLVKAQPAKLAELRRAWDAWNARMLPYRVDGFSEDLKENYAERY